MTIASLESQQQTISAAGIFRKEFQGYQKITQADYLEHSLLFGIVKQFLKDQQKPCRILDLGSGDSGNIAKLLSEIPESVSAYTGVDMSKSALTIGQQNVQTALGEQFPASFHLADMLTYLRQAHGVYDIVLGAFSLHHLTTEDKREVLRESRRCISPSGGTFLMVDPFRREGESLEAYRQRATEVGNTWTFMPPAERQNFIKHMQDCDIVEEKHFFEAAAQEAGYSSMEVLCKGEKGLQSCVTAFHP